MIQTLIVGFGFSATTFHLPFLLDNPGFHITGVVSSRADDVHKVLPQAAVYADIDTALQTLSPDLTIITTPNHLHFTQAKAALEAGSHVLVEKPFTLSTADAKYLVHLAEKSQLSLCVYQNRRFDGDFLTVQQLMQSGELGNVKRVVSRFDRFRPMPRDRWRENAGPGSGIFWDLGPHLIDQCMQLFGTPEKVSGHILTLREGGQSDDAFELTFYYSDVVVTLGSSPFQAANTLRFDVQGDKGSYRKYGLDPQEDQLKAAVSLADPQWGFTSEAENGHFCDDKSCKTIPTAKGEYATFYQQLYTGLTNKTSLPATAQSVLPVIALMERASELGQQNVPFIFTPDRLK
ncbi:Gfo/Idh/MocA family oxidoreductase [Alteromonas pelagimontana]|uniref:Gfo/Idh/MocA family oxidoreductase n=1 Tax=Alteromonas pelagimontana TaxID=1858656 RepID=A0A6M4MD28_9ALTE|nr:Gfo/Idh/MocA family oxidoreductase [Alteromonas pelagimontana]QJR80748.1 Gfo/Idh/MocA family oxidoreductase [Alteromonas pelagimontana]